MSDPQVITSDTLPDSRRGADGKVYPSKRSAKPPITADQLDELKPETFSARPTIVASRPVQLPGSDR